MNYLFSLFFILLLASTHASYANYSLSDSLKLEKIANKIFIRHQVQQYEDLTIIARKYGLATRIILLYNPEIRRVALKKGQIIRIPYRDLAYQTNFYTVKTGDNLYRISIETQNSVNEIKKLNSLLGDALSLGQQLIIYNKNQSENSSQNESEFYVETSAKIINNSSRILRPHTVQAGETLFGIARQNQVSVDSLRSWNQIEDPNISVGQVLQVPFLLNTPFEATAIIAAPNQTQIDESAMAQIIPYAGTQKVALHRNIPTSTIVKVYYESTERFVEVRIIGKLPDIQANKRIDIKISEAACKKLGAVNALFPVILFYSLEKEE